MESFGGEKFTKALVAREGKALARTVADKATMDDDSGAKDWLVTEEKVRERERERVNQRNELPMY